MSRFNNIRVPIEYVVNQHFQLQRTLRANMEDENYDPNGGDYIDDNLSPYPALFLRDGEGRIYKIIYGDLDLLESDEESDPIIWQEEFFRNNKGAIEEIETTYPDGETVSVTINREDGMVVGME